MTLSFKSLWLPASAILVIGFVLALERADWSFAGMWFTPAQQYQYLYSAKRYEEAAHSAVDPMQKGAALYKAGQFKEAASIFGTVSIPETLYNRGNSYMMQGLYDNAISSYELALKQRPEWTEARENLTLALLRKEKMTPPEDDYGGTGGQLEADEIVFDQRKGGRSAETTEETDTPALSKDEQRALWLRKVQTRPADFLRYKFSHQLSVQNN